MKRALNECRKEEEEEDEEDEYEEDDLWPECGAAAVKQN